ncbi:transcription factor IIF subunit tfg1 [Microbotryomycetes sp. JL221]|nr:transcription factor IIF subunit tfg1 [Microbotryomycetes sp. JL221]
MQRIKQEEAATAASGPSTSSTSSPAPSPLPSSNAYTDYVLYAGPPASQSGWRYNIMKFAPTSGQKDKIVDPSDPDLFVQPVKLNRKDPRTVRRLTEEDRERIRKRTLAKNGVKPEGQDGDDTLDDAKDEHGLSTKRKERQEMDLDLVGKGLSGNIPGQQSRGKGGMFKKKIRRVFVSSEEARRLKREEWMPWVFEDDEGNERWIGRLEGGAGESASAMKDVRTGKDSFSAKADAKGTGNTGWRPTSTSNETGGGGSSYVAFVNDPSKDGFQVVPVHRWYKFSHDPKYVTLGTEEAEEEYERQQKSHETERWAMHKRTGVAMPSAANIKTSSKPSTSQPTSSSGGPAIRSRLLNRTEVAQREQKASDRAARTKMTTVVKGGGAESGRGRKGRSGQDQEQEDDEFDFEEDFQDDEEGVAKIDDLADEEETKELEERIKREMRAANRYEGQPEVDDDEQEEDAELTGAGKEVKRLVRKSDKSGTYDSDDEEDDDLSDSASVASQDVNGKDGSTSRSSSQRPSNMHRTSSSSQRPSSHSRHHSTTNSRSGSPSGSALVAKRATSPGGGRKSLPNSRASSPGASNATKRRRDGSDDADAAKRRKNGASPPPVGGEGLLTDNDLIALFKTVPKLTLSTKDVLTHFRKQLKDERNKNAIRGLLQSVATLTNGQLVLKPGL